MKSLILLCIFCVLVLYKAHGQSVSLTLEKAPIETAFREIRKQTGYSFIYTRAQLQHTLPISIRLKKAGIKEALDQCFLNQPLKYTIEDHYIVVQTRTATGTAPSSVSTITEVSGIVFNDSDEFLSGVNVSVKGTSLATTTNDKGEFLLRNMPGNSRIVFSHVSYQPKEFKLNGNTHLEVHLSKAVSNLDETVVIAYGTTTRRLGTGSVSKITSEQIAVQPVSNPLAAMQGRVAGLNIVQTGGLPGSNFSVMIRGRNSIQNGTSPLYVIDGVPFLSDADRLTQISQINANSPFNTLNPADIESITVLKDADATAIYGSRGANGVILITTKKGSANKTGVDLNIYRGFGKSTYNMDYMDTKAYLKLRREAFANDRATPTNGNAPDLLKWDTTRYTDWKEILTGGTSDISNMQLRFSGGFKNTLFALSANHYKETTVFPGNAKLLRNAVSLTLNHRSNNNRFTIDLDAGYGSNNSHLYQQDLVQFINTVPNAPPPYDSSGKLNWSENGVNFSNPLANILRTYDVVTDRLTGNTVIGYKIGRLQLKSSFGYNAVTADENSRFPISSQNPALNPKGSASFGKSSTKSWIAEPQAGYTFLFSKASVQVLLGGTWQQSVSDNQLIRGSGYSNDQLINSTAGAASLTATAYTDLYYRYQSVYGRATGNWANKYLLNLTWRRDGSSRFGPGNQFANFGSIGAGWVFSEEKAIKNGWAFLSFGKLRGSYGVMGNDQIGDYQYLDTWSASTYPYGGISGLYPTRITNPYYGWEQKKNMEAGLDLGFGRNKYLITINWFKSRSGNQIIAYTLPDQTGSNTILKNFPGIVENKGWELEASGMVLNRKNFTWKSAFNLTIPKNKLVSFPGLAASSYANTYIEGQPLSTILGYQFLGVDPATGIYTFLDVNNDGLLNTLDYVQVGNTDPKYYGGFQNTFNYKGVELQFFFQFVNQKGRHVIYYGNSNRPGQQYNQPVFIEDHWRTPGDHTPYQQSTQTAANPAFSTMPALTSSSSAILTNGSYARLKNLSLSWNLPQKWVSQLKLEKARIYTEGQNLLLITKYQGPSPENQSRNTLPPLKVIAFGLQLTF